MQNDLHPVRGNIIVRPGPKVQKTQGGILLPGGQDQEFEVGEVISVGPGVPQNGTIVPNCCTAGEQIMYRAGAGIPLSFNGVGYLVMDDTDVVAHVLQYQGEQNEVNES